MPNDKSCESFCTLPYGHPEEKCVVLVPRSDVYERQPWDTKTPDPTGWRLVKCSTCDTTHPGERSACPGRKK